MALKGAPTSPETRAKMSAAALGRPKSAAARAAMSAAKLGKPGRKLTEAEKAHLSEVHKGKTLSPEHRQKLREAKLSKPVRYWLGKVRGPLSEEAKRKQSASLKGKPAQYPLQRFHYNGAPLRSTYELRVAKAFDALGIAWEFEPYRFNLGGSMTYLPDFYLPAEYMYVEVKGYYGPDSATTMSRMFEAHPDVPVAILQLPQIKALEAMAAASAAAVQPNNEGVGQWQQALGPLNCRRS